MRILHIIPAPPAIYGGAQRIICQLIAHQNRSGIDAEVITLYSNDRFLSDLEKYQCPYHVTGAYRPFDPRGWGNFLYYLIILEYDIIHLHMTQLWSQMIINFLKIKRCPIIYHAHIYPPERPNKKHLLVKWLLSQKIDAITGVSKSVTAAFRKCFGDKIPLYRTIYNGIRRLALPEKPGQWPAYMANVPPGRPLIGMATRFAPDKGIKEFLDTLPAISRLLPEARFVLAGDGPLLAWAQNYAADLGVKDKLALPGFIQDMPQFWAGLDFALFTAPREPFGLRIIEPQAAGTVVAGYFNGSGSDEIIVPGETGILVPWGHADALAREISNLWFNEEKYDQITKAAMKRLESHFSLEKMSRDCLELYYEVLNHRNKN